MCGFVSPFQGTNEGKLPLIAFKTSLKKRTQLLRAILDG